MIYLFPPGTTDFSTGGLPLPNAKNDKIIEVENGRFDLEFDYPVKDTKYKKLQKLTVLRADSPIGEQAFFIRKITKRAGFVRVYAVHVFFYLQYNVISSINVDRVNGWTVMQRFSSVLREETPFSFFSDLENKHTLNLENINAMDALAKDKHCIIGQWGGVLVRDNFAIKLLKRRGRDTEFLIAKRKNVISPEINEETNIVTRLYLTAELEERNISAIVDSPLINEYPQIYADARNISNDEIKTQEDLIAYGQRLFENDRIDLPEESFNVEVTDDVSQYGLGIDDTALFHYSDYGLYKRIRVCEYAYSPMAKRYIYIRFGQPEKSLLKQAKDTAQSVAENVSQKYANDFEARLDKEIKNANQAFDAEFNKRVEEIYDGIEQSKAEAEEYADNIRQNIESQIAEADRLYQEAQQVQDRQIADVLAKANANTNLANAAKQLAEHAQADLVQTRTNLTGLIDQVNTKANQLEQSLGTLRTDVISQAQTILEQARAQTDLTSRVATVETTANGTKATVTELSKTLNRATGDIASVSSRTKTVEDSLSQTKTQYEALTQTVNIHTGQIDAVNRRTGMIEVGLAGVTERFDNLQVGARNYAEDYDFSRGLWEYSQGDSSPRNWTISDGIYTVTTTTDTWHQLQIYSESGSRLGGKADSLALLEPKIDEMYTLSVEVKVNSGNPNFWVEVRDNGLSNYNNIVTHIGGMQKATAATSEWVRYSFTGIFKPNHDFGHRRIILGYSAIGSLSFRRVELTRGTIPMDAGPAIEDSEGRIKTLSSELATYIRNSTESSVELSRQIQTVDGKVADAKNYAQQTAEGLKTRIESLETYKNAEGIRASQYFTVSRDETARQVSALRTAVTSEYVARAKYEEDVRGIIQRFESLSVGGRNYIRNFGFTDSSYTLNNVNSQWRYERIADPTSQSGYHIKATCTQAGTGGFHRHFVDLRGAHWQGRTMTYAVDVKCSRAVTIAIGAEAIELGIKNQSVSTEWQRFSVTGQVNHISTWSFVFYIRNAQWSVGDVVYIRDPQLEDGNMATTPSPAPEDQQSYADTKIAEYSNTVDGRFATIQSQVSGKANQVDLQMVRETVNLYERTVGSTEAGIKDKVARMVMSDSLFLTEVRDRINGTATQVNQLSNSWAVRNLTSAGSVLNQINLSANGTNRIDGRLTHITGQTLIDNAVITSAMIANMDAGKITTGHLSSTIIATNSITGDKLVFDKAFFNKMTANEAYLNQLFAKNAFITSVQAVEMSANKIVGGLLRATNGAMEVNMNAGQILYYTDQAALKRVLNGYPTQFVKFATGTVAGKGNAGVTVIGSNRWNSESSNNGGFVGMRAWNGPDIDLLDLVGDEIRLTSSPYEASDGWSVNTLPGKLNIDARNDSDRPSSRLYIGDVRLFRTATSNVSLMDVLHQFNKHLQNITGRGDVILTWDTIK